MGQTTQFIELTDLYSDGKEKTVALKLRIRMIIVTFT